MALRLFGKKNKTINLIITDSAIRFVEISQIEPLIIEKYGERALPEGIIVRGEILKFDELQDILENCVEEWKIKNRFVRFTVPDPFVALREEKVDIDLEIEEIKNHFFMQIGSSIHLPFDEPVFDVVVIGQEEKKQHVLLVAAPEEKVRDYTEVLEQSNLKPIAADIDPLSLYRLYHQQGKTNPEAHELLVHVRENIATFSIFHENQPKFMKPVFTETNKYAAGLSGSANEETEELADVLAELERVISFYENSVHKGEIRISTVFLTGDHPQQAFIRQSIEQLTGSNVHADKEIRIEAKEGGLLPPAYFPAAGLGLKDG